jgi:hypothetical protein
MAGGNSLSAVRRAFATRGVSFGVNGSGAPSIKGRVAPIAVVTAALVLLAFVPLSQAKVVVNGFGTAGTLGGQLGNTPGGVTVNNSGAGGVASGTTYVVDTAQNRIERFSPAGVFERTWGFDVDSTTAGTGFEICTASSGDTCKAGITTPTTVNGGQLSSPQGIAVNSANGDVYVTETGNRRVQEFDANGNFVRAWGFDVESSTNEIQAVTVKATGGKFTLAFGGKETAELAFNATAAQVKTALEGLTSIGAANVTVANGPGDENGTKPYEVTFTGALAGTDVAEISATSGPGTPLTGGAATVAVATTQNGSGASTGFEVCAIAARCKQAAAANAGAGQFGGAIGYPTVDASNNVWVPDQSNSRIQEFSSTGSFLKMAGADVITDGAEGTGTLSSASTTVSALVTTKHFFEVGQVVTSSGAHIPAGTKVVSCTPAANANGICLAPTSLVLSQKPTANGAETITAAPGAGNLPVNEQQTITIGGGATGGSFNLVFNGQETKFTGTANFTGGSTVLTNVVTAGTFEVGQGITATGGAISAGTTITAVDTVNHTLTLSNSAGVTASNKAMTGFSVLRNSTAAALQAKLEALSTVGAGNVSVSGPNGGPWVATFQGTRFAGADVPLMTTATALSPSGTATVTSANPGALETCSVAAECRTGAPGTASGQFGANSPGDLAFDSSGNLYAIDTGNKRVEQFNSALTSEADFGVSTLAAFTNVAPEHLIATQGGTRLDFAVNNTVNASERQIVELDTGAVVKDTSMVGGGLNGAIGGLGVNTATGNLYATTVASASPRRVLVLSSTALPAPVPVSNAITTKTDTTATFNGTVDPTGGLVSCQFEYSTDQVAWTLAAVPGCETLAPGGGAQAVSANVTGLIPGTHYFVRLAVSRPLVANSTKLSFIQGFNTDAVAPVISSVGSVEVTDTSARLVVTIDPKNSATAYVFEYGLTPSLGSQTSPVSIGSGTSPVIVSQVISGLSPATTYYFRVAATNTVATSRSASSTLTTRAHPLPLPDDRRYEQVSPVNKGFANVNDAILEQFRATIGEDGNAVSYCNAGAGGAQITLRCGDYITRREADSGWNTRVLAPPACGTDLNAHEVTFGGQKVAFVSSELNAAMIGQPEAAECGVAPLSQLAPLPGNNLYRESLLTDSSIYDLLTPGLSSVVNRSFNTGNGGVQGGSSDFSHVAFISTGNECQPSCNDITVDGTQRVFEWAEGEARLVSRGTNNLPLSGPSNVGGNPSTGGGTSHGVGAVSRDGTHIYFQNPTPGGTGADCVATTCELYLRKDGTTTAWASEQECSPACANNVAPDAFVWGNPAGDRALFVTGEKLVNADTSPTVATCPGSGSNGFITSSSGATLGCSLYEYRDSAAPASNPNNLVDLSIDNEPADGTSRSLLGILGMSDDGDTVYFVASSQLVSGSPTETGAKLYRWRWNGGSPQLRYLATVASVTDSLNWTNGNQQRPTIERVDGTGSHLLFESSSALDPVADKDTDRDIYRWGESEGWRCLSCQLPGTPSVGNAELQLLGIGLGGLPQNADLYRVASSDMERVFFMTPDALVPADVNGQASCPVLEKPLGVPNVVYRCQDLYEWHDGQVSLISTGTGNTPVKLIGTTPTANDVFFITGDQLVGWDTDDLSDIYDARVGGGFPEPAPEGSCDVNAGACEGQPTSAPAGTGAGTAAFEGPGNQPSDEKTVTCRKGFRKVKVKGHVICKKTHHKKRQLHTTGKVW